MRGMYIDLVMISSCYTFYDKVSFSRYIVINNVQLYHLNVLNVYEEKTNGNLQ